MQTSGREQFEEQWKNAFEGSEAAPSDRVWRSVEGSLVNAQNDINKRRVVYYQRLAAALLLLCVSSVLITYWQMDGPSPQNIAENTIQGSSGKVEDSTLTRSNDDAIAVVPQNAIVHDNKARGFETRPPSNSRASTSKKNLASTQAPIYQGTFEVASNEEIIANELTVAPDSLSNPANSSNTVRTRVVATNENDNSKPLTEEQEKAIVKKMLTDAGVVEEESTEEKKIILKNPAWISVGASGGSYATHADGPTPSAMSDFAALSNVSPAGAAYNQTSSVNKPSSFGTAYSFGFMVGKPLNRRWLLQAGLTYVNRRSDYESNIIANGDQVFFPQIIKSNMLSSYSFTTPYAISSTSEFLSLPLQVGFVLIDKKVGWIINSGISGDLFLTNTLVDKSGTYKLVSQSGDDTAFRSVSWSGLASTEVTLRLSEHYRFALVPGLRYSITNIVKDDSGYSKPLTLDIGFRFRYTF